MLTNKNVAHIAQSGKSSPMNFAAAPLGDGYFFFFFCRVLAAALNNIFNKNAAA